jgi:hypothetical protein
MRTEPLSISSEAGAWEALSRLLDEDEEIGPIEFDGWPVIALKFEGDRYSASLPTGLMRQISDIQGAFNRCYARVVYDKDARGIRHAERDDLELVFEISKGSTELRADATGLLDRLGDAMKKPSTAKISSITLVVLALIVAGSAVASKLSADRAAVDQKKLHLLQRAIEVAPDLKDASPEFQKVYRDIVAAASDADRIEIGSQELESAEISEVASSQRISGRRIELQGLFRVDAIRRFKKHCLIDVLLPNGDKIRARIIFDRFPENSVSAVLMAVAKNTPIELSLTAMQHKDGYSSGRITGIGG